MATHENVGLAGPTRPLGSPDIPQFYLPGGEGTGVYRPVLYGAAIIVFGGGRRKINESRRVAFLVPLESSTRAVDWDLAKATEVMPEHLLKAPPKTGGTTYVPLSAAAMELKSFTRWAKNFDRWLARTQKLVVTPKTDEAEDASIGPKRGGVSVELVGIGWELT